MASLSRNCGGYQAITTAGEKAILCNFPIRPLASTVDACASEADDPEETDILVLLRFAGSRPTRAVGAEAIIRMEFSLQSAWW